MPRRVIYDMDGKILDNVCGDFHFWPSPHVSCVPIRDKPRPSTPIAWVCETCGLRGKTLEELDQWNCKPHEPCESCGLRGICSTYCEGVLGVLESPEVYLAGQAGGKSN